jgi:hypothetical protein
VILSISPQLSAVLVEWDKAEKAIKIAEQVTGEVAIPSIMELRYAGRRIADAFSCMQDDHESEKANHYLVDAKFDCLRAQHDALDICVNYIAIFVDEVMLKTEPQALEKKYDEIMFFLEFVASQQTKIADSRSNRDNREIIYDNIHSSLIEVQDRFRAFKLSLIEIIKMSDEFHWTGTNRSGVIKEAYQARVSEKRTQTVMIAAAIFAATLTLIQYLSN